MKESKISDLRAFAFSKFRGEISTFGGGRDMWSTVSGISQPLAIALVYIFPNKHSEVMDSFITAGTSSKLKLFIASKTIDVKTVCISFEPSRITLEWGAKIKLKLNFSLLLDCPDINPELGLSS